MAAVLLFVACIKTIKYFDVTKTMTIIYLSIDRCFSAVTKYLVVIMIVVFSFAVLGYCAFGTQVEGFSTVGNSLMSAMRILVRDFDYRSIEHVDQTLTTIFFNMYTCVVVFVFLTMLVAIAFHAYFDVDIEELIGDRKHYVWDKVVAFFNRLFKRRDMAKTELEYMSYEDVYKLLRR
ncbi:polycystic kidney disease 2-like 1 protein isoform X2 [Adelges cooleyi]|uniref:polycystic kidney disease 2-like 1 protein isoform X2 n=1 Tax=Adelges cooleyi TaxID=133065 RepID=UPI00217F8422|nr:polycystic kidney disease 2-like 1 protein isoform X2 [Adelges cooleyi]